ncbi:MAG: DUF423 domain-containing protein [Alphaproteobacteria bacterium]|nr:MAG: DUF423 domain-containing protein [Alphaproteobacteria bacterium]
MSNALHHLPRILTGFSGVLAVAMGAVAAHAVASPHAAAMVQQAALYQLIHTVALLVILGRPSRMSSIAASLWAAGILLFSIGLYARYIGGLPIPSGVVPFGGICYMLGWFTLAIPFTSQSKSL